MMLLRMVLKEMVNPLEISMALLLLALVFARRPGVSRLLVMAAGLILLTLSTPKVSDALVASLENQYAEPELGAVPVEPAIVVLGGALRLPGGRHSQIELADASDRLRCAAQLFRLGKAPLIAISGGSDTGMSESRGARSVLVEWGIPADAILTEEASRTTNQNAALTNALLRQRGISRAILVTSASHMARAVAAFRKVGLTVVPVPADFRGGWKPRPWILDYVPTVDAFRDSAVAIRERLGLAAYRVMGWS